MTHAVAAELEVHGVALLVRNIADGCRDITETVARLSLRDAGGERILSAFDQAQVLGILVLADHEADGGVADPPVDADCQVEADQIAVFQVIIIGDAMQHGIVDRNADVMLERASAEIRGVIHVAGFCTLTAFDAAADVIVDVKQIGSHAGLGAQFLENAADKMAGRLHCFDFLRCFQFDHNCNPTSCGLQSKPLP